MRMRSRFLAVLVALVVLSIFSSTAWAQSVYAIIHGTVTDASGAVVPNATVVAVNTSTNIKTTVTTDSKGYYIFPQLQTGGPYSITVTAQNFKSFEASGLMLNVNDNREVSAKLDIGTNSTTVQVAASALQVETSDTQLKQVVSAAQLEQIPLLGRDPAQLQKLQPGVVEAADRFGTFSTNGSQTAQNSSC